MKPLLECSSSNGQKNGATSETTIIDHHFTATSSTYKPLYNLAQKCVCSVNCIYQPMGDTGFIPCEAIQYLYLFIANVHDTISLYVFILYDLHLWLFVWQQLYEG